MSSAYEGASHTKKLIFDSSHSTRHADNPAHFTVNFGNSAFSHGNIIKLMPVDIIIPNMFGNVTAENRRFVFTDPDTNTWIIDMPLGHYTIVEYMDELTAQIAASGSTMTITGYTLDPVTSILSIQSSAGVWSYDLPSTSHDLLGSNHEAISSDGAGLLTFNLPVNFSGEQLVIVESSIAAANTTVSMGSTQGTILDVVSLSDTCYGNHKHHFVRTENVRAFAFNSNTNLQNITIRLLDTNLKQLVLPANQKVYFHMLIIFGSDT